VDSRADLDFLREYNEALVVALARRSPTFDRATIAAGTGLTPQAVSKVIARLTEAGLVEPVGVRKQGVGKPTTVYGLIPTSRYAIGAHVARRTLRLVLVDLAGRIHDSVVSSLPADFTPAVLLDDLAAGVAAIGRDVTAGRLVGVGIGMVGPLDFVGGVVRSHDLRHWRDVSLRDLATDRLGLPVVVDKDVTAGVTAEAWRRGPEFRDAALIMVESGVGAGLWLGGAAFRGAHTNAGEFGHTVIQLDGPLCVCGRHGCVEIVHDRAVAAGDLDLAARVLAAGILNLLQTVDVKHVVLAGADLLDHVDRYTRAVSSALATEIRRPDWLTVEVTPTAMGADVIAAGAGMEVLNSFYGRRTPAVGGRGVPILSSSRGADRLSAPGAAPAR
jgi:predicted NBD/HSP70 family sugar kinase